MASNGDNFQIIDTFSHLRYHTGRIDSENVWQLNFDRIFAGTNDQVESPVDRNGMYLDEDFSGCRLWGGDVLERKNLGAAEFFENDRSH